MTCQKQINYQTLYENIKYQINRTNVRSTVQKLDQSDQKLCKQISNVGSQYQNLYQHIQSQINRLKDRSIDQKLYQQIKIQINRSKARTTDQMK